MKQKLYLFIALAFVSFSSYIGVKLEASELQEDIDSAAQIVQEFQTSIPESVIKNAKGLAIIKVIKGAFFFSGRGGKGLVIAKNRSGWSAPSAIAIGGAGYGLQFGIDITDFIFVLNTQEAVDAFSTGGNVTLGVNLSVAAGPVGRTAEGGVMPVAAIYSYSLSQGAFAGISLEGTVIGTRKRANAQFYGKPVTAKELLSGKVAAPKSASALYDALKNF